MLVLRPRGAHDPCVLGVGLQERQALESMRREFENELTAARSEVAKAQQALLNTEERVRSAEQVRLEKHVGLVLVLLMLFIVTLVVATGFPGTNLHPS